MKILGDYIMLIVGLGIDMCFCHCAWHVLRQGEAIGFFFQVEDGIRDRDVTGVQTCALPIYVREVDEFAAGHIPGAKHVPRSYLESRIEGAVPDRATQVILYCQSGNRSAYAVRTLRDDLG